MSLEQLLGASLAIGLSTLGAGIGTLIGASNTTAATQAPSDKASINGYEAMTHPTEVPEAAAPLTRQPVTQKKLIPIVFYIMIGVQAIYGLIISVIITAKDPNFAGVPAASLSAGLTVGLATFGACLGLGAVARKADWTGNLRATILALIFSEALGLYGLIVALMILSNGTGHS